MKTLWGSHGFVFESWNAKICKWIWMSVQLAGNTFSLPISKAVIFQLRNDGLDAVNEI
jgi:hypothetical protein